MTVYLVYEEYQAATPTMHRTFRNKAEAEEYAEGLRLDLYQEGLRVYDYEPPPEQFGEDEEERDTWYDWQVDVHVEEVELDDAGGLPVTDGPSPPPRQRIPVVSPEWRQDNAGRLTAVAVVESVPVHVEAIRVRDIDGVQEASVEGLRPDELRCNAEVLADVQRLSEGRFVTTAIAGHPGEWVCFAFPFQQ